MQSSIRGVSPLWQRWLTTMDILIYMYMYWNRRKYTRILLHLYVLLKCFNSLFLYVIECLYFSCWLRGAWLLPRVMIRLSVCIEQSSQQVEKEAVECQHAVCRTSSNAFTSEGEGRGWIRLIIGFQPLMVISPTEHKWGSTTWTTAHSYCPLPWLQNYSGISKCLVPRLVLGVKMKVNAYFLTLKKF